MAERDFHCEEFGDGNSDATAALITGFGGKVSEFATAINRLIVAGHDVAAYEYSSDVLQSGDPDRLPQLIEAIRTDLAWRTGSLTSPRRYAGVSLGMGIALNLQREDEQDQLPALYAAGGTNVARMIAGNMIFNAVHRNVRRAFWRKGHDEQSLREAWAPLHESPNASFAVALGGLDFIVSYRKAIRTMHEWKRAGTPVSIKTLPRLGHTGTIHWFNHNIAEMLDLSRNDAGA